ncbi:hypothetical protein [Paenibacillus graminis]|uniref:Uncharacterized protein n=1 Tax=Paenibacillus graminis TaxID=189425 RepID=A0A089NKI1_9BACL|nr:hypothetical protein [Paenibacillus graminis]AIQ69574.1 hypothetical protein PGRAT_19540 [Paenibacillus graminis]
MKHPVKTIFALLLMYVYLPIAFLLYMCSFQVISWLEPNAYYRYATDGKYTEDIFFKGAMGQEIEVSSMLESIVGSQVFKRPQDLFSAVLKKEDSLRHTLESNNEYMLYLKKNNLTVDHVIAYMKKISDLDDNLMNANLYLTALGIIMVYYLLFKYRNRIYLGAGLLYIFLVIDAFTYNLVSDAFYPQMKRLVSDLSYEDYLVTVKGLLPALREATLTFIIFDTVIQSYKDRKNKRLETDLKISYYSLEKVLNILKNIINENPKIKLVEVKINKNVILEFCKKNKQDQYLQDIKKIIEHNLQQEIRNISNLELYEIYSTIYKNLNKSTTFKAKVF